MLTPKEIEILRLIADGLRNKEIAQRLEIALKAFEHNKNSCTPKLTLAAHG